MARFQGTKDDRSGLIVEDPNPAGWLIVTYIANPGSQATELAFQSWQNFREWVELSDPGCGQVLTPP